MNNAKTKTISLHKFILLRSLVSYGAINVLVNMVIFYIMHWNSRNQLISSNAFFSDIVTTSLILSFTVGIFAYKGVKKELKKGISVPIHYMKKDHLLIKLLPSNLYGASLIVAMASSVFIPLLFTGLGTVLNLFPLSFINGMVLKGFACGAAGSFTGYFMIILALLDEEHKI